MKRALITGITGQDGAYLAELLLNKGYEVFGGLRHNAQDNMWRLRSLGIQEKVKLISLDITDLACVIDTITTGQFDEVYNLAAQSFVGASWKIAPSTTQTNANGVLNLVDSIKRFSPHTSFYQASTSEMFGLVQDEIQSEKTAFYPRSPYGVAKLYGHWITKNYRESYGLKFCSGILFNHESPLRGPNFVTKKISSQLAEIKLNRREALVLGNLNAKRDWGYAKEYVQAMWQMVQQDVPDDYVIATGSTTTVRDFVNFVAEALEIELFWDGNDVEERGIDKRKGKVIVEVSPDLLRPAEVDVLIGDPRKAQDVLDWKARTTVKELAEIMSKFDYDNLKGN
mgnify:CR=1 FL=1